MEIKVRSLSVQSLKYATNVQLGKFIKSSLDSLDQILFKGLALWASKRKLLLLLLLLYNIYKAPI